MPTSLRSTLLDRYRSSLPGHLHHVDTANNEGPDTSCAQAIHFDWYNRYSTLVSLILFFFIHSTTIACRGMEHQQKFTQVAFKNLARSSGLPSLLQGLYRANPKNYWTIANNIHGF
jgi:hypothetical protein